MANRLYKNFVNYFTYIIISSFMINISFANTSKKTTNHKESLVTIDLYGTDKISLDSIKIKYEKEFNQIAKSVLFLSSLHSNSDDGSSNKEAVQKIESGIKSLGKFSYVKLSPVRYPNDNIIHITIDVVEEKDKHRLSYFMNKPNFFIKDPEHLIAKWISYNKTATSLLSKENKFPSFKTCPAFHCTYGFDHPALRKYKNIFNKDKVELNKLKIIEILKKDKDEAKRGAAAFLLAHIKNEKELIHILIPSIYDPSPLVRNNTMRVIGFALLLHPCPDCHVPIKKVVNALNFPQLTDRHKALSIILPLVDRSDNAKYVLKNARQQLIAELKLQQPNVHNLSYQILKKISGKDFGEHSYKRWEMWSKKNV